MNSVCVGPCVAITAVVGILLLLALPTSLGIVRPVHSLLFSIEINVELGKSRHASLGSSQFQRAYFSTLAGCCMQVDSISFPCPHPCEDACPSKGMRNPGKTDLSDLREES